MNQHLSKGVPGWGAPTIRTRPGGAFAPRARGVDRTARLALATGLALLAGPFANAASITWIGANNTWIDNGSTAFWNPADEPDPDDTAIFNTANAVSLGSNNAILALTMSGGIDLLLNGFNLDVNGLVQLTGASTNLVVGGNTSLLSADAVSVNSSAKLNLEGGGVTIVEEAGDGLLNIAAGGELLGYGAVNMNDAVAAGTTLIYNEGSITARHSPLLIFGVPPLDTLSLNASDGDTRLDLDGFSETGIVNVTRNQTLDVNIPAADSFSGTINLFHNATLDMAYAWFLNATGVINIDNGFVDNPFPTPDVPADVSMIAGASFTQLAGTINVLDGDGALRFDTNFTMNSGTLNNNGLVIFDGNATIAAGANFNMGSSTSSLTVEDNRTVQIQQTNFNLDGTIIGTTVITVNPGGNFTITSNDYDSDSIVNAFNGVINLNSGTFLTNTGDAEFVMDGVLNMNNSTGTIPIWTGEPLDIGNDSGTLNADLNIIGPGTHNFAAPVDFNSDADVDVPAGSILQFTSSSTVNFDTVNGGNNAEFTGAGTISFNGVVNVNEAATLNLVGGTVDFDGTDSVGDFINIDAPLTVNVATMNAFGKTNLGGGTNTFDVNNNVGTGVLTVNLDDPSGKWTLNPQGALNLVNDNTAATLLAGVGVNLNGTVFVVGDVRSSARLDIAGTVNIQTVNEPLRLAGGTSVNRNTIAGATINGPGLLGADTGRGLSGFGIINANVDFDGAAILLADNGTLNLAGSIVDVGTLGTADADGILNVVNAWNSNVCDAVQLNGGSLLGGTITNGLAAGITGYGTVNSRIVNNTRLSATAGNALIFETAANDNDWDGASNAGQIQAVLGNMELRDNATFGFGGTVTASGGHRVSANGFALDFNPGSTLQLGPSGAYESTNSTDLGGTVTVNAGGDSTIIDAVNRFLTFQSTSSTTLNGNLLLDNNNITIQAGATFSGSGALVNLGDSHLVIDSGATVNALLINRGTFRPSGFATPGSLTLRDFSQTEDGELIVDLNGTLLNQFDRVLVSGNAQLDGRLQVQFAAGFNPPAGTTFDIIATGFGVSGHFDVFDFFNVPAGKSLGIDYLPNTVRLTVVNGSTYDQWINSFPSLTNPADKLKTADPDNDGQDNETEFALDGDPTSGRSTGKYVGKIAPVGGVTAMTLTFPVRSGAATAEGSFAQDPPGGSLTLFRANDELMLYTIQASDTLASYPLDVDEVTGSDATAIQTGMPALHVGWTYRSFRSPGPVAGDPEEFMRLVVTGYPNFP